MLCLEAMRILEACRRVGHLGLVVDEGKIAPVVGQEGVVVPGDRQVERGRVDAVGRKEAGRIGFGGQVGVEAEDDVGSAALAFEPEPAEEGSAVARADEADGTVAGGLEVPGDLGAGAPLGGEARVGVDDELGLVGGGERGREKQCGKGERQAHLGSPSRTDWRRGCGLARPSLPSAGMSRFRFDGSASAAISARPVPDPPRQAASIGAGPAGARAFRRSAAALGRPRRRRSPCR